MGESEYHSFQINPFALSLSLPLSPSVCVCVCVCPIPQIYTDALVRDLSSRRIHQAPAPARARGPSLGLLEGIPKEIKRKKRRDDWTGRAD